MSGYFASGEMAIFVALPSDCIDDGVGLIGEALQIWEAGSMAAGLCYGNLCVVAVQVQVQVPVWCRHPWKLSV